MSKPMSCIVRACVEDCVHDLRNLACVTNDHSLKARICISNALMLYSTNGERYSPCQIGQVQQRSNLILRDGARGGGFATMVTKLNSVEDSPQRQRDACRNDAAAQAGFEGCWHGRQTPNALAKFVNYNYSYYGFNRPLGTELRLRKR